LRPGPDCADDPPKIWGYIRVSDREWSIVIERTRGVGLLKGPRRSPYRTGGSKTEDRGFLTRTPGVLVEPRTGRLNGRSKGVLGGSVGPMGRLGPPHGLGKPRRLGWRPLPNRGGRRRTNQDRTASGSIYLYSAGRLGPIIHGVPRAALARASRSTFLAIIRQPASRRCITALRARRKGP